jgi:hypothetical protein
MSIPSQHLSALRLGRETLGPALVHGVPVVVVDRDGDGGIAGDLLHGLAVDQADALELTGEVGDSLESSTMAVTGTCTTTQKELALVSVPADEADHLHEGVAATLVPGSHHRRGLGGPRPLRRTRRAAGP